MIGTAENLCFLLEATNALSVTRKYTLGKTFSATFRPSRVSRARYTSPIPPAPAAPTAERISLGPSFVPEATAKEVA